MWWWVVIGVVLIIGLAVLTELAAGNWVAKLFED